MNMKQKYLAFLVFLLIITISLSIMLVNKNLKNEQTNDIRYIKTTVNNTENKLAMFNVTYSDLSILNIQSEEVPNPIKYEYKIKIEGIKGPIKYKYNDNYNFLFFDNNEASFTLNSNEKIILYDIPVNSKYTIEQSTNDNYKTLVSGDSTNIFSGQINNENNIEFKNISTIVTTNPNTTDNNMLFLIIFDITILIILTVLNKIKIQRYENIAN